MARIRVLLADDHSLFREGLAGILGAQPDMEVVGEASDGLEAVVMARQLKPDLVLMDIQMPGMDGLEATRQIARDLPEAAIVILTVRDDAEYLFEAVKNGARGYLLKNIRSKEMIAMLRGVAEGEAPLAPAMAARMIEEFRRLSRLAPEPGEAGPDGLTERETEVLALAAAGKSDKEIAETLSLSLHTVKSHMRNILAKLHVGSRREAARLAKHKGWV
jgi:DNA-binding NarL/FixJ family response regulator